MKKIKTGDQVQVLTGKDKGKTAKILRNLGDRVILEGLNLVKKHVKPNPNKNVEGGIVSREASMHISNVALFNAETGKKDRVGIRVSEEGKKERFFKSSGQSIK